MLVVNRPYIKYHIAVPISVIVYYSYSDVCDQPALYRMRILHKRMLHLKAILFLHAL